MWTAVWRDKEVAKKVPKHISDAELYVLRCENRTDELLGCGPIVSEVLIDWLDAHIGASGIQSVKAASSASDRWSCHGMLSASNCQVMHACPGLVAL